MITTKIIIVLISVLFSIAFARRNAYQRLEAGANPLANHRWHKWEFVVKCCFVATVALTGSDWWFRGFGLLMAGSIDFLFFPYLLNNFTGQRWFYLSDNGIDKFLKRINPYLLLILKVIVALVTGTYYFANPFTPS